MHKMYRASFIADQDGHLLDARLQGIGPGLAHWLDLRQLEVNGETNLLECQPTQEDREKLEQACKEVLLQERIDVLEAEKDGVYRERNMCVAALAHMSRLLGYTVGIAEHQPREGEEWDMNWSKVLFIDLPEVGQVSWHLHTSELSNFNGIPPYARKWDGHDTTEKYDRLQRYFKRQPPW